METCSACQEPAEILAADMCQECVELIASASRALEVRNNPTTTNARILVTKCRNPMLWYSHYVGETFPYLGDDGHGYEVRKRGNATFLINYRDCEVIPR